MVWRSGVERQRGGGRPLCELLGDCTGAFNATLHRVDAGFDPEGPGREIPAADGQLLFTHDSETDTLLMTFPE